MDMPEDLCGDKFPVENIPECFNQYYGTVFCERCPIKKLCAETKNWDVVE